MSQIHEVQNISDLYTRKLTLNDQIVINSSRVPQLGIVSDQIGDILSSITLMSLSPGKERTKFGRAGMTYLTLPNNRILDLETVLPKYVELNSWENIMEYTPMDSFYSKLDRIYNCIGQFSRSKEELLHTDDGFDKYIILPYTDGSFLLLNYEHDVTYKIHKHNWQISKRVFIITWKEKNHPKITELNTGVDIVFDYILNSDLIKEDTKLFCKIMKSTHKRLSFKPYEVHNPLDRIEKLQIKSDKMNRLFQPWLELGNLKYFLCNLDMAVTITLLDGTKEIPIGAFDRSNFEDQFEFVITQGQSGISPFDGCYYANGIQSKPKKEYHHTYDGVLYEENCYVKKEGYFIPITNQHEYFELRQKIQQQVAFAHHLEIN